MRQRYISHLRVVKHAIGGSGHGRRRGRGEGEVGGGRWDGIPCFVNVVVAGVSGEDVVAAL